MGKVRLYLLCLPFKKKQKKKTSFAVFFAFISAGHVTALASTAMHRPTGGHVQFCGTYVITGNDIAIDLLCHWSQWHYITCLFC